MKRTINIFALAATLGFTNNVTAQPAQQQPEQLKYILELAGRWEGPATMKMEGKETHFNYYADFKKIASGNGLDMHEWGEIPGMGKMDGGNLIGYNAADGKIHWYSVDNMGTTHEHIGEFKDHDHYTMVHKSVNEGKTYMETIEMVRMGKDRLSFKLTATTDGHEDQMLTATFDRKGKK